MIFRFFYSLFLLFALLIYIPLYFLRLKLLRGESLGLKDRLGFTCPSRTSTGFLIWIHAVSVGEVLSLRNLIGRIKQIHPEWSIYLSVLTNSGYKVARNSLNTVDKIFLIPFDLTALVRRYFKILRPDLFLLAESEFWPNLLHEAGEGGGGVLVINGRISSRSFSRYSRIKSIFNRIVAPVDLFLVQTEEDSARLLKLGITAQRIRVSGNLKAEIELLEREELDIIRDKQELGILPSARIVVAGSTHKGEEERLLTAFAHAGKRNTDLVLILAPRHPDRSPEIERLARGLGLRTVKKSHNQSAAGWEVMIVDSIGELARLYSLCDAAFIGGSLIKWGGQNLLEPAFYAKPIFFGPYMFNFAHLADLFVKKGGAEILTTNEDLKRLFSSAEREDWVRMGTIAREILRSLQGATAATITAMEESLNTKRKV